MLTIHEEKTKEKENLGLYEKSTLFQSNYSRGKRLSFKKKKTLEIYVFIILRLILEKYH